MLGRLRDRTNSVTTTTITCCFCSYRQAYQSIVEAEWQIIYDKLDKIVKSGAQIVLSRLAIGDLATQYFADRGVFCAGRVPNEVCCHCCIILVSQLSHLSHLSIW
jgi:T-complex protein 1 subunit eta